MRTRLSFLVSELEHEAATTRQHLRRLEDEHLSWRPHPKSFSVMELGSHLVDCIRWTEAVFGGSGLDVDPESYRPFSAADLEGLVDGFDAAVARGKQAMLGCTDDDAQEMWTLRMGGKVWFEKQREEVFRDMTLHHLIHHRGQLSVYLRLLDLPVPGSYGPTADEQGD